MRNSQLDRISWRILAGLQADARLSYAEIGRRVGLSTPAAARAGPAFGGERRY